MRKRTRVWNLVNLLFRKKQRREDFVYHYDYEYTYKYTYKYDYKYTYRDSLPSNGLKKND
jgi:hypothetical protein